MYANPPGVNRNCVQCFWDNSEERVAPIEELEDKVNGTVNNNKAVALMKNVNLKTIKWISA